MRKFFCSAAFLLVATAGASAQNPAPVRPALVLSDSIVVRDGRTGARIDPNALLQRLARTDIVLLGEVHDNGIQHATRGQLIAALADRRPAIVFEQFAVSDQPIAPPAAGEAMEAWLDAHGFDRTGWKWPLHQPVVDAAIKYGRSLWGANFSRESLRGVVMKGDSAAPEQVRPLMQQVPLDNAARAALDHELDVGHCHQLPQEMFAGMRGAQVARDAAMAQALTTVSASGPALLIAGNGHVRRDFAVPRLLRVTAPGKSLLSVGFLEREENGSEPPQAERAVYDIVLITPRATRPDPCAGLK